MSKVTDIINFMNELQLTKGLDLRLKIKSLEQVLDKEDFYVRNDEPYFEEIKELVKKKRQEYIDHLKKQLEAL